MVAADHPDRAVIFEDTPRLFQPMACEIVIGCKAVELIPLIVAGIDLAAFWPEQVAAQLEIVGRISKNHVD